MSLYNFYQLVNVIIALVILLDSVPDAAADVVFHNYGSHLLRTGNNGIKLVKHVNAVLVLFYHALDAFELPFHFPEPYQYLLFVLRIRRHKLTSLSLHALWGHNILSNK